MPRLPEGQTMWIAYLGEVRQVKIIEKGHRGTVFKRGQKPKDPYVVLDEIDEEEFVMASDDLHHNPRDAQIAAKRLAKQEGFLDEDELRGNPVVVTPEIEVEEEEEEPEDEEDEETDDDEEWEEAEEE